MLILKEGVKPRYIKKCSECGSVLVYQNTDIQLDMTGDNYIECPVCKDYIPVSLFRKNIMKRNMGQLKILLVLRGSNFV